MIFFGGVNSLSDCMQIYPIIAVKEINVVTRCAGNPGISRAGKSLIFLMNYPYSAVLFGKFAQNRRTRIRRAVINADYFCIFVTLPDGTFKTLRQILRNIVNGNYNADFFHVRYLRSMP